MIGVTVRVFGKVKKHLYKDFTNSFKLRVYPEFEQGINLEDETSDSTEPTEDKASFETMSSDDWKGPIYESIKEAPYDITAPIPYVSDLSTQGFLRIGWDAKM